MSSKHSMNFYGLLGLSPDADVAAIEKAFKAMSRIHHPDKSNAATRPKSGVESQNEREAREKRNHDRYVRIVEARDTLVDEKKRKAYDRQQGVRNPPPNNGKKTKDSPPQSTARAETKSRSKSKSKSETKSKTRSTAEPRSDDAANRLIEGHLDCLEVELSCIKHMNRRIDDMLYTLESTAQQSSRRGPDYSETMSLLQGILRRSRSAREDIYDAIKDLEDLSRRSLSDSKKRTQAEQIYDSAINGALDYIHRAEKTVEELEPVVSLLDEGRWG